MGRKKRTVNDKGADPITVTRRGRPVDVLAPAAKSPRGMWAGKIRILGDIANTNTADLWHVVSGD